MTNRTVRGRRRNPKAPRSYLNNMRHYVYRHFDKDGQALYIGCSTDVQQRFKSHMFERTWWAEKVARTKVTVHPTRAVGWKVEKEEIARLEPLHNGEVQLMATDQWNQEKFVQHGIALAQANRNGTVNPKSALGKLAVLFERQFGEDLLEHIGPVRPGFRRMDPDESRPSQTLRLEDPFEYLREPSLPPVLRAVS